MVGPRIVAAGAEDVEELVRLNTRLFLEDAGTRDPYTDGSWPGKQGRDHFLGLLARNDAVCFLALMDGSGVGYLAGYIREGTSLRPVRVAELQSMYVEEDERNRGAGGRLVEAFFAWARNHELHRVSVSAYAANEAALRFYERSGFRPKTVALELGL